MLGGCGHILCDVMFLGISSEVEAFEDVLRKERKKTIQKSPCDDSRSFIGLVLE